MSGGRKVLVRALGSTGALFIQAVQLLLIGVQVFPVKRRARVQVFGVFRAPFGLRLQRVITGFFLALGPLIFLIFQRKIGRASCRERVYSALVGVYVRDK